MKRKLLTVLLSVFVIFGIYAQKADIYLPLGEKSNSNEVINENTSHHSSLVKKDIKAYQKGIPIYMQHDLITQVGAGTGGADISEVQSDLGFGFLGFGFQITSTNSIADDFTVAAGETWAIDGFQFYGYQTGSPIDPSSFTEVHINVYDGDPSAGGTVIQDFFAINNLINTEWTGIYRVMDTDIAAVDRPIMFLYCEVPEFTLTEGTYWVEWSAAGTGTSGPWCPAVTLVDVTDTGNAMQNLAGTWGSLLDGAYPQGVPFDIYGSISLEGAAPVTFIVENTANTSYTGFALKGSWDGSGYYDAAWNGGLEQSNFYDDGTHGDVTADDNIWTVTVNLVPDAGANTWEWGVNGQDGIWIDGNFQFTVSDDTPQTLTYATVGVNGLIAEKINIFPNPSNGIFNINVESSINLEVFDITGRVINSRTLSENSILELKTTGVYFLRFSDENSSVTQRVIVQ